MTLRAIPTAASAKADPEVVAMCVELLARARSGEIKSLLACIDTGTRIQTIKTVFNNRFELMGVLMATAIHVSPTGSPDSN